MADDPSSSSNSIAPKSPPPPPSPPPQQRPRCAACREQKTWCSPECLLAPYFPADEKERFLNAHRLFGTRNIRRFIQGVLPEERDDLMSSIKYQAQARARNPQCGATGVVWHLERHLEHELAKLSMLQHKLEMCKDLAANKGIPKAKGVGVHQVMSQEQEQEQERHCQACPARLDATLACSPECLLELHFPDGKPHCFQFFGRAFMEFAGLERPLMPTATDANVHGLVGLNNIDDGGLFIQQEEEQVWATRYGVAGVEQERVHAEIFASPQPHQQHRPADHAASFDNRDLLLGTHAAIDVHEADALAVVDPVSGVQGMGVLGGVNQELGCSRTVQHQQQQQQLAPDFQENILLLGGDLMANAGHEEEAIVYEAGTDALAVDPVDDPLVKEFLDKLVDEVLSIDARDMEALFQLDQSKTAEDQPGDSGVGGR